MDGGPINVKNVDQPIRIWRWTPDAVADGERDQCASLNAGNSRPHAASAVFAIYQNVGDPEREYFSAIRGKTLIHSNAGHPCHWQPLRISLPFQEIPFGQKSLPPLRLGPSI
jgi:hypothetical protein